MTRDLFDRLSLAGAIIISFLTAIDALWLTIRH